MAYLGKYSQGFSGIFCILDAPDTSFWSVLLPSIVYSTFDVTKVEEGCHPSVFNAKVQKKKMCDQIGQDKMLQL